MEAFFDTFIELCAIVVVFFLVVKALNIATGIASFPIHQSGTVGSFGSKPMQVPRWRLLQAIQPPGIADLYGYVPVTGKEGAKCYLVSSS